MGKVIGAVFTIVGGFITIFMIFVYQNSPLYLDLGVENPSWQTEGLLLPGLGGLFLLVSGIVLLVGTKEPRSA